MELAYKLLLIAVMVGVVGWALPIEDELIFVNATSINAVGLANNSGNNVSLISEINHEYWQGNESTTPFKVYVNFTNITQFSYVEIMSNYSSVLAAPSSDEVNIEIFCNDVNEYVYLTQVTINPEWAYFTRNFPDSMHFINDSNVSIRFNHISNGNVNHRIKIDDLRLAQNEASH